MTNKQKQILKGWFTNPKSFLIFLFMRCVTHLIKDDESYLRILYRLKMDKCLNLENPQTFQEKLQWLKLHNRRSEFTKMVDKHEAKKYVTSIIGEEYIIPTLCVWDIANDIDYSLLPDKFVLKCTHDSGRVIICKDKERFNTQWAHKRLNETLKTDYYKRSREYPYKNVRHRIIAEQYMEDENGQDLIDYKFFCFNGKAKYCQVIQGRTEDETIDFFDRQWNHQEFIGLTPNVHFSKVPILMPEQYQEMLRIADTLASGIETPFVRIDLYVINGHVYFGEITFFPNSGFGCFHPYEWNRRMGEMMTLQK